MPIAEVSVYDESGERLGGPVLVTCELCADWVIRPVGSRQRVPVPIEKAGRANAFRLTMIGHRGSVESGSEFEEGPSDVEPGNIVQVKLHVQINDF
jgi:hypothetical protein